MEQMLSSRERMLQALNKQQPDYVPCCFMIFQALRQQYRDQVEFMERQLDMGLDVRVELPELPIRIHPDVKTREWKELPADGARPLLHKRYTSVYSYKVSCPSNSVAGRTSPGTPFLRLHPCATRVTTHSTGTSASARDARGTQSRGRPAPPGIGGTCLRSLP